jgi:hypothetical protein
MFSNLVIAWTVLAAITLTPLGIFLVIMGAHGPALYSYIGFVLLLPSAAALNTNIGISIPLITPLTLVGICIFVVLQLAYFYLLIIVLGLLVKKVV